MRRKAFGRDLGLSIRMALALLPILALYAVAVFIAFATLLIVLSEGSVGGILGWAFFAFCFGVGLYFHVIRGDGLALRIAGARKLNEDDEKELQELVRRTAVAADLPPPQVALIGSMARNAFAVGLRPRNATVAVTTGLVGCLEPKELEAVVGHELAHIANRDGAVMTFVSGPPLLGDLMRKAATAGGLFCSTSSTGPSTFSD